MIQRPRGTRDYIEGDFSKRRELENKFVEFFSAKDYLGIETPMFEQKNLFVRSVGDQTDIVQKELFNLEEKSDEIYSLRPELTAGIIRALIESGDLKTKPKPINVFALGPCFRYERPQKGRRRQFNQLDLETIGKYDPELDAKFITDIVEFLGEIGMKELTVNISSFGSQQSKQNFSAKLREYFKQKKDDLCETCAMRADKNPLRILDCKNPACQEIAMDAPKIELSNEEDAYFKKCLEILEQGSIKFQIDPTLVRGLDYYTGVIFEINVEGDESRMSSIGGGGRYDNLIAELGGPDLPAMGVGLGFERIVEFLD